MPAIVLVGAQWGDEGKGKEAAITSFHTPAIIPKGTPSGRFPNT